MSYLKISAHSSFFDRYFSFFCWYFATTCSYFYFHSSTSLLFIEPCFFVYFSNLLTFSFILSKFDSSCCYRKLNSCSVYFSLDDTHSSYSSNRWFFCRNWVSSLSSEIVCDYFVSLADFCWEEDFNCDSSRRNDSISLSYFFSINNFLLSCSSFPLSVSSLLLIYKFSLSNFLLTFYPSSNLFSISAFNLSCSLSNALYFSNVSLVNDCCASIIVWYFCPFMLRSVASSPLFFCSYAFNND
jgi:hypothetical protein